jgi:hypothetical protein
MITRNIFLQIRDYYKSCEMKPYLAELIGLFFFILFSLGLCGCGESKPDGLPELQPVTLTFTLDGQPCGGASVHLIPQNQSQWAVGGVTDSAGTVVLKTHGKFSGAPVGKYKMIVSKLEQEDVVIEPTKELGMESSQKIAMYHLIDPMYSNPEKTSLEIEVTQGKKISKSFDLGKKVRIKMEEPPY